MGPSSRHERILQITKVNEWHHEEGNAIVVVATG